MANQVVNSDGEDVDGKSFRYQDFEAFSSPKL